MTLTHKFVEYIPDELDDGTIYISIVFATAAHKCCCGCGSEVVTPLSPTDWKVSFDGVGVTFVPSIGNWGFTCQSHYWIEQSRVRWARRWSREEIAAGRAFDARAKKHRYDYASEEETSANEGVDQRCGHVEPTFWSSLKNLIRRR